MGYRPCSYGGGRAQKIDGEHRPATEMLGRRYGEQRPDQTAKVERIGREGLPLFDQGGGVGVDGVCLGDSSPSPTAGSGWMRLK